MRAPHLGLDVPDFHVFQVRQANPDDLVAQSVGLFPSIVLFLIFFFGVTPKGAGRKSALLTDCAWNSVRRNMHLQGPRPWWWLMGRMLVPIRLRGLVPPLMPTIVHVMPNSGSMAMVAGGTIADVCITKKRLFSNRLNVEKIHCGTPSCNRIVHHFLLVV